MGSFNKASEGSVTATATPEQRRLMNANKRRYYADQRVMERWYYNGCMADGLGMADELTSEERSEREGR